MNALFGFAAAHQRNQIRAAVITGVEATSGGDTLVHVGNVNIDQGGTAGRVCSETTIRLSAGDLTQLVGALQLAQQAVAS